MDQTEEQHVVRRGTDQVRLGDFNQTVILDAIRRSGTGLSRSELARRTGLSAQAITTIARTLLDSGLVREGGREHGARGKPRTPLLLDPTGQYAVGVHLDPAVCTYVLLDLTGRTVARSDHPTPTDVDPPAIIAQMAAQVARLLQEADVPRERVGGVGVAAPGPIDVARGVVVDPPNLTGWQVVPLREDLALATGLPVLLDKDVTAAAAAQKWVAGPQGHGSFALVYLGVGVGAGLVLDDEVVRGASYNVGEIGHSLADPDGPLCPCGRRGCLGASCQPRHLVGCGIEAGVLAPGTDLEDRQALEEGFAALSRAGTAGDPRAAAIMSTLALRLLRVAEQVANLLDLDRVVFGGPHWPLVEPFLVQQWGTELQERFQVGRIHPLEVAGSELGADLCAVGAASLVLDHTFSTNPAVLLKGA